MTISASQGGVGRDERQPLLDEVRRRRQLGVEAADDVPEAAVAEGLQGVQLAGQIFLDDEGGPVANGLLHPAARDELLGAGEGAHGRARWTPTWPSDTTVRRGPDRWWC